MAPGPWLQAKQEPVDLSSFEAPTSRRFVARQLQLMREAGYTKQSAYQVAEDEFAA